MLGDFERFQNVAGWLTVSALADEMDDMVSSSVWKLPLAFLRKGPSGFACACVTTLLQGHVSVRQSAAECNICHPFGIFWPMLIEATPHSQQVQQSAIVNHHHCPFILKAIKYIYGTHYAYFKDTHTHIYIYIILINIYIYTWTFERATYCCTTNFCSPEQLLLNEVKCQLLLALQPNLWIWVCNKAFWLNSCNPWCLGMPTMYLPGT